MGVLTVLLFSLLQRCNPSRGGFEIRNIIEGSDWGLDMTPWLEDSYTYFIPEEPQDVVSAVPEKTDDSESDYMKLFNALVHPEETQ